MRVVQTTNYVLFRRTTRIGQTSRRAVGHFGRASLAYNIPDDQALLEQGMANYHALYSWATHLQYQKHTKQSEEQLLHRLFTTYLDPGKKRKSATMPENVGCLMIEFSKNIHGARPLGICG